MASNRYAPHLSGCLGIGTGSRRGAARNAAVKNKWDHAAPIFSMSDSITARLGAELDRGASPLVGSDYGSPARDAVNGKAKGKGKNKKINGLSYYHCRNLYHRITCCRKTNRCRSERKLQKSQCPNCPRVPMCLNVVSSRTR